MEFGNLSLKCVLNKKDVQEHFRESLCGLGGAQQTLYEIVAGMQQHLQNYCTCDLNKFIPRVRDTVQSVDRHLSK